MLGERLVRRMNERVRCVPPLRYLLVLFTLLATEGISFTWKAIRRKLHVLRLAVVRREDHRTLAAILNQHRDQPIILYLPVTNWNIPLFQRPQQLARALSRQGFLYFYCTDNCLYDNVRGFEQLGENLYLNNRIALLKDLPGQRILHLYSTDYRLTPDEVRRAVGRGDLIVYEYVDELDDRIAGRPIPEHTYEKHRLILGDERCIVISTADKLHRDVLAHRSRNCALVTNGVDVEHFARRFPREELPAVMGELGKGGREIIGYFGALASWVDYELLLKIVRERPGYEVVLIGFDYDGSSSPYHLDQEARIHLLGPVGYHDLPRYACCFDVAMIPFRINAITESTSPIKLFEYMALGKPIVTTPLPECRKYRSVLVAEDHGDFLDKLDRAMTLGADKDYRAVLRLEAEENSWEEKSQRIAELIRNNLAQAAGQR